MEYVVRFSTANLITSPNTVQTVLILSHTPSFFPVSHISLEKSPPSSWWSLNKPSPTMTSSDNLFHRYDKVNTWY